MNEKVIGLLNQARILELGAIAQYMVQHYELEEAEFGKLGDRIKEIAIREMKHAEELAERIIFLGGTPVTKAERTPSTGQDIPAMLTIDIGLETDAIKVYNESAKLCVQEGDNVSRDLFAKLAEDEESHLNDFQNISAHVEKMGAAYLATLTG